ncbi:MAG: ArsA-related P-loop ATPase [Candidatus Binatia bacterium]|nr:ArsA-related P-loop ATPase [Candidatus Binatia bacterium]MDG2009834.1 ArsA-related P-loop ATPase [Candidatus Binatia bacterium]HAC81332.1 arsenic transporter [Deltaproteobacteria bacterium]
MAATGVQELIADKRVVVVCGAGGVGKTTTSASLALAAARSGRRVLVITIDPSKRLAQTLDVSPNATEPTEIDRERLDAMAVPASGSLSAWMLDPQAVSDSMVRRLTPDVASAERLLENRVYRNITSMIAGMQEYMAVEALHEFVRSDRYDLIVLDTPPSRDALRFLDAPSRSTAFLDRRVLGLFIPDAESRLRRAAAGLFEGLLDLAFGKRARAEIQQFFVLFEQILAYLGSSHEEMQSFFGGPGIAFLLVSSPAAESLAEADYFAAKAHELSLPVSGFVLNRSLAGTVEDPMPTADLLPADASADLRAAWAVLQPMAQAEASLASEHVALARTLGKRFPQGFVIALPDLPTAASELRALLALAESLEGSPEGSL